MGAAVYIEGGRTIALETHEPGDRLHFDQLVYATSARVVLTQRRRFNLHATLIVSPAGRAVAITGESMSGKSTTTIELSAGVGPFVRRHPGDRRLSTASRSRCRWPVHPPLRRSSRTARRRYQPWTFAPGHQACLCHGWRPTPRELSAVYRLGPAEGDIVTCKVVPPFEALSIIAHHGDPYGVCQLPEARASYLAWTAVIASHARVFELKRPAEGDSVEQVADFIERGSRRAGSSTSSSYHAAKSPSPKARPQVASHTSASAPTGRPSSSALPRRSRSMNCAAAAEARSRSNASE